MKALAHGGLVALLVVSSWNAVRGQQSKSAPLAQELAAAMTAAKLDSVAAKDPSHPDVYIGALYIPGLQLLTIAGAYTAPPLLDARLANHEYREVYIELNGTTRPDARMFIEDLGANGLAPRRDGDDPFDSVELNGKRTMFDGNWGDQNLSEEEYQKIYSTADQRYAQLLEALLAQLKTQS
jgi:hypothetical protein